MELRRKALERFEFWRTHKTKQALLVTGSRQVGKSYLVSRFAQESYGSVAYFDLLENRAAAESFNQARDVSDLLFRISVLAQVPLVPHETVVVFDEVQECPTVITLVKYLVDRGDYDYILTGSLLGVELEGARSLPVGYLTEVQMFPLDFEEFCWAVGVQRAAFDALRDAVAARAPIPEYLHDLLLQQFKRYLLVGGMPDAVVAYRESNSIDQVRVIQSDIRSLYRRDITKYAPKERRLVVGNIYEAIPAELIRENRRFRLSSVEDVKRFSQVDGDLLWLTKAGVALAETSVTEVRSPLLAAERRNAFKLFLSDVGLLTGSYTKALAQNILDGVSAGPVGGVYENYVAEELAAHGFALRYFSDSGKRIGELDAVVERADGRLLLFEVKSGGRYRTHAALDHALEAWPDEDIDAYVLSNSNIEVAGPITYLPAYAVGLFSVDE